MATKNFKAMSTKKLNNLLMSGNLSEEETLAVQNELNERTNATAAATAADTLSDEERAALGAAEASAAQSGVAEAKAKVTADTMKASSKKKMTDEERDALALKLRQDVLHHRCEVVPFNSIEWVQGTVVGVIVNKKMNTVSLAIKTDDGSRIVKAHDSKLIKVLEEKVEIVRSYTGGGGRKTKLDENGNPIEDTPWTADEIEKGVLELGKNVGKMVLFNLRSAGFGAKVDEAGNELEDMVTGRITSIVPNKRNKTFLYAIQYVVDGVVKTAHKVSTLETLKISEDEMDEVGKQLNEKFIARRTGGGRGTNSREAKLEQMKKELDAAAYAEYVSKLKANAESRLANAKATLEALEAELAAAQEAAATAEQANPTAEPNDEPSDLM